jgi:hypothetical protein
MSMTDRDLLLTIYAAFNRRDIDAVLTALHPEVDWPNGMEGGRVYGREASANTGNGSGNKSILWSNLKASRPIQLAQL